MALKSSFTSLSRAIIICLISFANNVNAQVATTTINQNVVINPNTKPLLGVTYDARTGMASNTGNIGYFTPAGNLIPNIDNLLSDFPLNGLRYPGQAIMVGFQWKKAIGLNPRPTQNILGPLGPTQSMSFGFDEFMAYIESKGLTGADIQIMIPIYDSAITYSRSAQNNARVPFPALNAADWVEYANCPSNLNWGNGIAWGAFRAANGHSAPYNIRTWNIGNEPWSDTLNAFTAEFGNAQYGVTSYFNTVTPIIDSMLARDPSIHITIPTTGNANSFWNKTIRNYKRTNGKIYGISPHFFQIGTNVDLIESTLKTIVDSANAAGLKIILGDYSHEITNGNSTLLKNRAMSWQGANFAVDMLLMCSQLNTIERANQWAFGMPYATWRPIRPETNGTYTLLPIGEIYKFLHPYFSTKSISTVSTSPIGSDAHPYSIRASAFLNNTNDSLHIVAINRDPANTLSYNINGLSGFNFQDAKILSSDSLTGEVIYINNISPDINGNFTLPPSTILLLTYTSATIGFYNLINNNVNLFPNPFILTATIKSNTYLKNADLTIYNSLGEKVKEYQNITGKSFDISREGLTKGIYLMKLNQENNDLSSTTFIVED